MNRATKKIVIDAARGGDDIGNTGNNIVEKDFNLKISQYILKRLNDLGVEASITRDSDITLDTDSRVQKIQDFYGTGSDVVVISNALTSGDSGSEIVYALRNSSGLAEYISSQLEKVGIPFNKYYQRRLPSDTSKDYNQIIRDTANNQSIIIYYGNVDDDTDIKYLQNNLEDLAEAVVIGLANYLGITYVPTGGNYYIVKKGDSLYSIARTYNTTVSELVSLNKLSNTTLSIGQVLKLPTSTTGGTSTETTTGTYIVQSGDTLYSIANQYNTTVDTLKNLNNLTSNLLSINQILKVPTTETETEAEDYITYTVKSGDTLYSIARAYNTTVDIIKSLNNLSSNLLSIGQTLKIPESNSEYITYTVKSGDSLYSIARTYNTTVDTIKSLNNLTSNLLSIGQVLKISTNAF